MSDYQARLKLARDAYQATLPDLVEVNAGVARVGAQLAAPAAQLRRLLHLLGGGALLAGLGLIGGAALSEGGEAEPHRRDPSAAPGAPLPHGLQEPASAPGDMLQRASHPLQSEPAGWLVPFAAGSAVEADAISAPRAPASARAPARAGLVGGDAAAEAPAPALAAPPADWAAVSSALARGDAQQASGVLAALARSEDASTRAKALLGQAQIHLSKGERAEAGRLAAAAASVPGASAAIRMKAVRWAARASL